jgi:DNA repair protein REV1
LNARAVLYNSVNQASELCPDLVLLPYYFEDYEEVTKKLYTILCEFADDIQAVSCDEAYIDVSSRIKKLDEVIPLAENIRRLVLEGTQCHASIGAGENMLLARMATNLAKPNGSFFYDSKDAFIANLSAIPIKSFPGVGWVTVKKLDEMGIKNGQELLETPKDKLRTHLGSKNGESYVVHSSVFLP